MEATNAEVSLYDKAAALVDIQVVRESGIGKEERQKVFWGRKEDWKDWEDWMPPQIVQGFHWW